MKQYISPRLTPIHVAPSALIAESIADIRGNAGLNYGGGTSGDHEARSKDAGDWDIWGKEE